jgi:hypothetical protein
LCFTATDLPNVLIHSNKDYVVRSLRIYLLCNEMELTTFLDLRRNPTLALGTNENNKARRMQKGLRVERIRSGERRVYRCFGSA